MWLGSSMTERRSDTVDYSSHCTICVTYDVDGIESRLVFERPQMQLPDRPLTTFDLVRLKQFPDDAALDVEARQIFADMKRNGRLAEGAVLRSIFIARTAAAALEMRL